MKKTMKFLSMAALALMGAVMTSCSSGDNAVEEAPQQPASKDNVVTLTTTVGLGGTTRAVDAEGHKTFSVGDQIDVVYENTSGHSVKVTSEALTSSDIIEEGKSAKFTVTLTNHKTGTSSTVWYYYPAGRVDAEGNIDYIWLDNQNGTIEGLSSSEDFSYNADSWYGEQLPEMTLNNYLTIGKFTLKNPSGTAFNNELTSMTVSDGTYSYTITPSASTAEDPIWVAMRSISAGSTVTVTATDGTNNYSKTITIASGKDLLPGNIYPINVTMIKTQVVDLSALGENYEAQNGDILINTLAGNYKITIADGATVTLRDAIINGENNNSYKWAGITCVGDATIILEGTNTVKGFYDDYPGIHVPDGSTLTIQGTGSLTSSSNGYGAGIGGGNDLSCGNIVILGGTINAYGGENAAGIGCGFQRSETTVCGYITISGGTVTAYGGYYAAGIGGGDNAIDNNGDITISGGTVTAYGGNGTSGFYGGAGIGSGNRGRCGNITISGGTVTATGVFDAAGIGSARNGKCGNITITSGVTSVTATKNGGATNSIGPSIDAFSSGCGTVTIGGTVYWDLKEGSSTNYEYKNGGDTYLTQSPLEYTPAP